MAKNLIYKHLKPNSSLSVFAACLWVGLLFGDVARTAENDLALNEIWIAKVQDTINPMVSEYLDEVIQDADAQKIRCLIVELDTPGGLLESTHAIVKSELNASTPIVVYVSPKGARAASAGVFITLAANIAIMAPATNIGAAHPVGLTPQEPMPAPESEESSTPVINKPGEDSQNASDTMSQKVMNDTLAWARTIAENRNRNAEWIKKAVDESVSSTEQEALQLGVIDLVCDDLPSLIKAIDGRTVKINNKDLKLDLKDARIVERPMTTRQRFLSILINPTIAIYLLAAGLLGLYIEITHPGLIFPGVIGGISLILALFAMHTLPINYAGLFLILLSFLFFIAEVKIQSAGLLTIGGIVAFLLGSTMLIDSDVPGMKVSVLAILPLALSVAGITALLVTLVLRTHVRRTQTGENGMVGLRGKVIQNVNPVGKIFVHSEIWRARSVDGGEILMGTLIEVVKMDGLTIIIKPVINE